VADVINRTTLEFMRSVNEPLYPEPTWKHSPDMSQVVGVEPRFWKWDAIADRPIPMTAPEQAAVVSTKLNAARDAAVERLTVQEDLLRAFMLLVLSEFNAHTAKVNAILSAIDAATTLANLKTAIAAIPDLPVRTEQQLRTAIRNNLGT
jgi:hypothetical protein